MNGQRISLSWQQYSPVMNYKKIQKKFSCYYREGSISKHIKGKIFSILTINRQFKKLVIIHNKEVLLTSAC